MLDDLFDSQALIDSVLPNVYIDSIVLQDTIKYNEPAKKDPHILYKMSGPKKFDPQFIEELVAKKILSNVLADPTAFDTQQSTTVRIRAVIKNIDSGSEVLSWLDDLGIEEFKATDFLTLKIVQSTDEKLTQQISEGKLSFTDKAYKEKLYEGLLFEQNTSLNKVLSSSSKNVYLIPTDNGLNKDIYINFPDIIINEDVQHLAYFVYIFLDIKSIESILRLQTGALEGAATLNSKMNSEIVVDKGQLVTTSYLFTDNNGLIWTGAVHKNDVGEWRTGTKEADSSKTLTQQVVTNTKVQDLRQFRALKNFNINFDGVFQALKDRIDSLKKFNKSVVIYSKLPDISEIFLSRTKEGYCNFIFLLDMEGVLKNYSLYPNLINKYNINEVSDATKINSLKVIRKRIDNNGDVGKDFTINEVPIPIASIENGTLLRSSPFNDKHIIMHRGSDKDIADITDGLYKYGISAQITDGVVTYLNNVLNRLNNIYTTLKQYLVRASDHESFDSDNEKFTVKFIQSELQGKKEWATAIGDFISVLVELTNKDEEELFSSLQLLLLFVHPKTATPSTIQQSIDVVSDLINHINQFVSQTAQSSTTFDRSGATGQSSTSAYKNYINIQTFKSKAFDSNISKNIGYDYIGRNQSDVATIRLEDFIDRIESETLKYFKVSNPNLDLKSNNKTYSEGDTIENTKYAFLSPSTIDSPLGIKYEIEKQGDNLFNQEKNTLLVSQIVGFNFQKQSPQKPLIKSNTKQSAQQQIKNNIYDVVLNRGAEISLPKTKSGYNKDNIKESFIEAKFLFSSDSLFNSEDFIIDETENCKTESKDDATVNEVLNTTLITLLTPMIKGVSANDSSNRQQEKTRKQNTVRIFDLGLNDNILERKIHGEDPKRLPNQIKSLLVASADKISNKNNRETNYNWFDENVRDPVADVNLFPGFMLSYFKLAQIEYADTVTDLNDIQWKTLTGEVFASRTEVFCRIKPYINKEFGVGGTKNFDLPVYNEFFIIAGASNTQQQASITGRSIKKQTENIMGSLDRVQSNQFISNNIVMR